MLGRDWLTKSCPAQLWAWWRYPGALGFFNLSHALLLTIRRVGPLRHDAFQAELAGLLEYSATVDQLPARRSAP